MDIETRTPPTEEMMNTLRDALIKQRASWCYDSVDDDDNLIGLKDERFLPIVRMDFDWLGYGEWPALVWEDGSPYDWPSTFPYGGRDPEFGFNMADVSEFVPEGWYVEAQTSWAVSLYEI